MLVSGGGGLSIDLPNAVVLALAPTLPLIVLAYTWYSLKLRLLRSEFGLRKSELAELNRALLLHNRVCSRIQRLRELSPPRSNFRRALLGGRADIPQEQDSEFEDLQTHAELLETMIIRLRCQPLRRLKRWIGVKSFQSALARTLAAESLVLLTIIIVLSFYPFGQIGLRAAELVVRIGAGDGWYLMNARAFYANAFAAGFGISVAPLFYLGRLIRLRRNYQLELCLFTNLARVDRALPIEQTTREDAQDCVRWADVQEAAVEWRSVLQVSQSAGIEEIRAAYRKLIKECHPDGVHGMSEAIRRLADVETKRLNSAYQQALLAIAAGPGS